MSEPRAALSPVFWVLFGGTLINRAASFVGLFLALHLTADLGISEKLAGWIVGVWGVGSWLASPVAGVLTDRVGRKATMLLGLVPGGAIVLALAFVHDIPTLFVLCFFGGATQLMYFPSSNAAIADLVPSADRPRAYGLIYWAANLGLGIGFAVGGMVPESHLWQLFIADAITTFLTAGLIAWKVPETRPAEVHHEPALAGLAKVATDRTFMVFAGLHFLSLIVFTQFQLALPLDMKAHGEGSRAFAWLMSFNCLGVVALQPWLAPKLRRHDASRMLAAATALFGLGYALNAGVPALADLAAGAGLGGRGAWRLGLYLLGSAFWTVGEVVGFPVAQALVADLAPVSLRGRYAGAFSMLWGAAMSFSPVLGGIGLASFGATALWLTCGGVALAVAFGHLAAAPARRRRLAPAT